MRHPTTPVRAIVSLAFSVGLIIAARPSRLLAAPFPGALTWTLKADVPGGVYGAAGGVIADSLYVSHGFRGADSSDLDVYDIQNDAWASGAAATVSRSALAGAVLGGKLYAIGGRGPAGTVEVYDPSTDTWTTVASLTDPRGGVCAASVSGLVYAIGGRTGSTIGSGTISDTVEAYDPGTDTWTPLAPIPQPVSDATATVVDGLIYVIGGAISPATYSSDVQIYDPVNDEWSFGASLPTRRAAMGSGTLCGQIVVFGGWDVEVGNQPATFVYDPADDSWTAGPDMPVMASGMAQGPMQTASTVFSVGTRPFGDASVTVQALSAVCTNSTPAPTATPRTTGTVTPAVPAPATGTATPLPTATATPAATLTPTETATPTPAVTTTATPTPLPTGTATTTPLPTSTETATATPIPTKTATPTSTATATATATPQPTVTATATTTPLPTTTETATATPIPTKTATPTATRTATPLPTATQTPLPTRTATATMTPTRTQTPTPTPTATNRPPDCTGAGASSPELWPPNHKYAEVAIVGVTDADGDPVSVAITSVTQDEPVNGLGDGDTCPDAAGVGGVGAGVVSVRSERSGLDDGRVYHVNFTATDGRGGQCTGTAAVCIPHDQRPGHACIDQGPLYDSTGPCR